MTFHIILAHAYDYEFEGPVENVVYVKSDVNPCYIAFGTSDSRNYFYHAAYNSAQCEFAERCKNLGLEVKVYGETECGTCNNGLLGIEYAGTNSKWWYANKAV